MGTKKMEIELLPNQTLHVERIHSMLDTQHFAFDLSMMGSGKTYTSSKLGHLRKFQSLIVICPASVVPKWQTMKAKYPSLNFVAIMSFQTLRSTKLHQPAHGLLYRREISSHVAEFQPTPKYLEYVEQGTLVIVDEIQNIKNVSLQMFAVQALTKEIMFKPLDSKSKLLLLSASPIDKTNQAVEIFRGMGVLQRSLVQYNPAIASVVWTGMRDILTFCNILNAEAARQVMPKQYYESTYDSYVYRLFQGVIIKHCSSAMPPPLNPAKLIKANAYYEIDDAGEEILKRGMHVLTTVTQFNGSSVHWGADAAQRISSIARALQVIETGKISLFTRIARQHLEQVPQSKVVIAVNYCDTLKDLVQNLQDFNPITLEGSMSAKARASTLDKFATASSEHRLLICNQSVASTGIDLDDKHGQFPRLCLVSPSYSSIIAFQLGHRFMRMDTRSDAVVHFVFALRKSKTPKECGDIIELRVLDALSKKTTVMRETSGMELEVQYPGEHDEYVEKSLEMCEVF
jgi:hypothetical protein